MVAGALVSAACALLLMALAGPALADECSQAVPLSSESEYYSWCRRCGGTPEGSGASLRCVRGGGGGGGYDEDAARRRREQEYRIRLQEQQRRQEEERRRREAEERRKKAEFERERSEALRSLKGVSVQDADLKSVGGDSALLGLKGVNAREGGLKDVRSASAAGEIAGALEQLSCGADISDAALELAGRIQTRDEMAELNFLNEQALNAIRGKPVEVDCRKDGVSLKFKLSPRAHYENLYRELGRIAEKEAVVMFRAHKELPALKSKAKTARLKAEKLKRETQASERDAPPEKEKKGSALEEALAALRAAEAAMAKVEAEREKARASIEKLDKLNDEARARPDKAEELLADLLGESPDDKNKKP